MIFLIKFLSAFIILFFGYIFYLSMQERRKFFNSPEYETSSMFEKIVLNTVVFCGAGFMFLIFISYTLFIISSVTMKPFF